MYSLYGVLHTGHLELEVASLAVRAFEARRPVQADAVEKWRWSWYESAKENQALVSFVHVGIKRPRLFPLSVRDYCRAIFQGFS